MSKLAEKLIILLDINNGLLCRLYNYIHFTLPDIVDEKIEKVVKAISKKFPETIVDGFDKLVGADLFAKRSIEIVPALKDFYETFVEIVDFKEAAWTTLNEMSTNIIDFQFSLNQDLMVRFLDLLTSYCQLLILTSLIPEKDKILAIYSRAYQCTCNVSEPNFSKLAGFVTDYSNPIRKLQEDCIPLSCRLGDTLTSLSPLYLKWVAPLNIRQQKVFNILDKLDLASVPTQLDDHSQLMYLDRFKEYVLYGFLICPNELQRESARELLKVALSDVWTVPIFRDVSLDIHNEYNIVFGWFKSNKFKLSKFVDLLRESATNSVADAGKLHHQLRSLLYMDLQSLLNCLSEWPGLIAPKIMMVLAALSLARSEIIWYFRHKQAHPPKLSKAKLVKEEWLDDNIAHLIYLVDELYKLALEHKTLVQDYYIEHIGTADLRQITPLFEAVNREGKIAPTVKQLLDNIHNSLKTLSPEILSNREGLEAVRLDWYRVCAVLSSASSAGQFTKSARDLTSEMNTIIAHSRSVDRLEAQLRQFGSLKLLWFFPKQLEEVFELSLTGERGQPANCVSFIRLLDSALMNVHRFCPEEQRSIGTAVLRIAQQYIRTIANAVDSLVRTIVGTQVRMSQQLVHAEAANRVQKQQETKVVQPLPGYESKFENINLIRDLASTKSKLCHILSALRKCDRLIIFDYEFYLLEFLRDRIIASMHSAIRRISVRGDVIARPSLILSQLQDLYQGYLTIDSHIGLGIPEIFKYVLMSEFYDPQIGNCGDSLSFDKLEDSKKHSTDNEKDKVLINYLSFWFMKFLQSDLASRGISYSHYWNGFLSRPVLNKGGDYEIELFAEQFADITELESLCILAGPHGIRVIERDLLLFLSKLITPIKECINDNRAVLSELRNHFPEAASWETNTRKLVHLDKLVLSSITLGTILQFRTLLHKALANTLSNSNSAIYNLLKWVHSHVYDSILFNDPLLQSLDNLCYDAGLPHFNDELLYRSLTPHLQTLQEQQLFDLLPEIYGICYVSNVWRNAKYNVIMEGYFNNAHTMSSAVINLINGVQGALAILTPQVKISLADLKSRVTSQLVRFIQCSAYSILHMIASVPIGTFDHHFPSLIVFLDLLVKEAGVGNNVLEASFPYSIIRTQYIRLYERACAPLDKEKEDEKQEEKI